VTKGESLLSSKPEAKPIRKDRGVLCFGFYGEIDLSGRGKAEKL
jgi:hypothetical protein